VTRARDGAAATAPPSRGRAVHLASTSMDVPGLDALADLVAHGDVAVLTGAGLSTDSGTDPRTWPQPHALIATHRWRRSIS
jgi:hypothetical protein